MFYIYNIILSLLTSILSLNIVLFCMDSFKLSKNKCIYFLQVFTPVWLILGIFTLFISDILIYHSDILMYIDSKPPSNNINIGANIEIKKETAEVLIRNFGISTSITGIAGVAGTVIVKSALPPVQKVGIILASGAIGGGIHLVSTNLNKFWNKSTTNEGLLTVSKNSPNSSSNLNLLSSSSTQNNSELMNVLLGLDIITYSCLILVIFLSFIILFKFYFNEDKINLNKLIGNKYNNLLNKFIILNKKTNNIYIILILIMLIISLGFNSYVLSELYNYLDKFIELHLNK